MLIKTCQTVIALAAASVAVVGIVLFPELAFLWAVGATVIGGIVSTWSYIVRREAGTAVRIGAAVAAVTTALGFTVAGSIVLLRVAPVWVVAPLLGLGGLVGWWHRRSWAAAVDTLFQTKASAVPTTTSPATGRATHGHSSTDERGAHHDNSAGPVLSLLAQLPSLSPGTLSTTQLCGAWQRSYWLLFDLHPGPAQDDVVRIRSHILDELERRNPIGFGRWMHTRPRAGGHPGQYFISG